MKQKTNILNLLICLAIICCSGVIQFSYIWNKESIICLFIFAILIFIIKRKKLNYNDIKKLSILLLILTINLLVYSNNVDGHISLILKIISICLLAKNIEIKEFKKNYINILYVISLISIVCYFLFLFFPTVIVNRVPIVEYWQHSTRYILIYNFPGNGWEYGGLRNFGPFHEGGMFAVFVDIALLFIVDESKFSKRNLKKIIVFVICLITTFSTNRNDRTRFNFVILLYKK